MASSCAKKRCSASHSSLRSRPAPNSLSSPVLPLPRPTGEEPDGVGQIRADPAGTLLLSPSARANPGRLAHSHSPLVWAAPCPPPRRTRIRAPYSPLLQIPGPLLALPGPASLCIIRGSTKPVTAAQGAPLLPAQGARTDTRVHGSSLPAGSWATVVEETPVLRHQGPVVLPQPCKGSSAWVQPGCKRIRWCFLLGEVELS